MSTDTFGRVQRTFFFILLGGTTIAFIWLLKSFLIPILWAVAFAVLFYPLSQRISRSFGNRPTLAALVTLLIVLIAVFLPIYGVGRLLTNEAVDLYYSLATQDTLAYLTRIEQLPLTQKLTGLVGIEEGELRARIIQAGQTASAWLATQAWSFGTNAASVILKVFIMFYLLFVLLRNGAAIGERIMAVLPLGDAQEYQLFNRFASTVRALFRGTLIVAVAQGLAGGTLFALAGIPNAFLWGVVMAIFALVPALGPGIIWLPTGLILLALGDIGGALIILIGGSIIVGLLDNILRPILIGRDIEMSDALVMLAIIGGLATFGMSGLIIGPVIASLFLAVWSLFEKQYRTELVERG